MELSPPRDRMGFEVAVISALRVELDAIHGVFDRFEDDMGRQYGKSAQDENEYTTGQIGKHNVVLAYMPGIGKVDAAAVAIGLHISFPGIKLALLVGVCGGVPSGSHREKDIYLGDLVISRAVVQYDFGRKYQSAFQRKGGVEDNVGRPRPKLRAMLAKLQTEHSRQKLQKSMAVHLQSLQEKAPNMRYPGIEMDQLYNPSYVHKHRQASVDGADSACGVCNGTDDAICEVALSMTCDQLNCGRAELSHRNSHQDTSRSSRENKPEIHFGTIGSGDSVMKSGVDRDRIAKADEIIAFEMEGAGVWERFPTVVVIKGVCDYADSHKNKKWQGYAAAVAAAGMKAFLHQWDTKDEPVNQGHSLPIYEEINSSARMSDLLRSSEHAGRGVAQTEKVNPQYLNDSAGVCKSNNAICYDLMTTSLPRDKVSEKPSSSTNHSEDHFPSTLHSLVPTAPGRLQRVLGRHCQCLHHLRTTRQTPKFLEHLLGILRVHQKSCEQRSMSATALQFSLPNWLASCSFYVTFEKLASGPPNFGLRFQRKVSWGAEDTIIKFALHGDLEGIKRMLDGGKASIDDVDLNHGRTALHYAVQKNHINVCEFLLHRGANPDLSDNSNTSATKKAYEHILTRRGTSKQLEDLRCLFHDQDLEEWSLSHLHKVVLEVRPLKLQTAIKSNLDGGGSLDVTDAEDRTPLHWAANIGSVSFAEILLDAGATVDVQDKQGNTPLIYAASSGQPRLLEVLVLRGACVQKQNFRGDTALHYASRHNANLTCVKILINARADVNAINRLQNIPFTGAAITNRVEVGEYLMSRGADTHHRGKYGDTCLFEAIYHNSHDFLVMLLRSSVTHTATNKYRRSVLHAAALEADNETIRILIKAQLAGLDVDMRNDQGETAWEICQKRINPPPGFVDLFAELLTEAVRT